MGKYAELVEHLKTVHDLNMAQSILSWDMETVMPEGGAGARAQQLSTLARLSHEIFTGDKTAHLLDDAAAEVTNAAYDSNEASMIRVVEHDYEDATKFPSEFVAEISRVTTLAHQVWAEARAKSDFKHFVPALQNIIDLMRQAAEYLGYDKKNGHPYDALLGQYERGMTTAMVKQIFDDHRPALVELIAAISKAKQVDDSFIHLEYDIEKQREFGLWAVKGYGFDFHRGIQAVSVHPFCTHFSRNDVRMTTRFDPTFMPTSLFGLMHESGHGMYEQGSAEDLDGTPLSGGTSLGVHESQSRLWENIVGRSKGFWQWAYPKLQETYPAQLGNVTVDQFYRAINKVERSFIRVEADEATYNLHIILRFEIEQDIVAGKLQAADLADAWNTKFQAFFGITPPTDALGVLQDVHWSAGLMGYFPTYALGNLLSVQYYNKALQAHPNIPDEIAQGKFDTLRVWMNENIHKHGRKFTGAELTQRVTGEAIQSRDYLKYLQTKYSAIYGL
jgi:carboxypeptidase Taq